MGTIADDIALQLANESGQHAEVSPASSIQNGIASGSNVTNQFKAQNAQAAADSFQQVLNQGFKGMAQAYNSADPEVKQLSGDPSFYQSNEDTMASWWAKFASAQDKVEKKKKVAEAVTAQAGGDNMKAQEILTTSGNVTPEVGTKSIEAAKTEADTEARGKKLQQYLIDRSKNSGTTKTQTVDGSTADLQDANSKFARQFKITSKRVDDLAPHIDKASAESGMPANLIKAIISVESTGRNNLTSSAKAKGLMQLTDATAKDLGVIDPMDPEQNIAGGTKYIKQMIDKYGDIEKAIAAYNAGPATVDGLVKKYGDSWKEYLPDETKTYLEDLPKYLRAYGGATVNEKGANSNSQFDFASGAAIVDPKIPGDPAFKEILTAMNNDQVNANKNKADIAAQRLSDLNAQRMQKRVDNIAKRVEPLQRLSRSYNDLNNLIPGGINGTGDIPGVGLGVNKFKNWLFATTKDSKIGLIRAKIAEITNTILQDKSGKQVTGPEGNRIMTELALTPTSTAADFRHALQMRINNDSKDYQQNISQDPEAAQLYSERFPGNDDPFSFIKENAPSQITTKSGKKVTVTKTVINH